MSISRSIQILALAIFQSACAHESPINLAVVDPIECEVIAFVVPTGFLLEVASPAPGGGAHEDYEDTAEDATTKRSPATLKACPNLVGRLSRNGSEVSRVAFNGDATRALVDVDCGPILLRRENAEDPWVAEATYTSTHGCDNGLP